MPCQQVTVSKTAELFTSNREKTGRHMSDRQTSRLTDICKIGRQASRHISDRQTESRQTDRTLDGQKAYFHQTGIHNQRQKAR